VPLAVALGRDGYASVPPAAPSSSTDRLSTSLSLNLLENPALRLKREMIASNILARKILKDLSLLLRNWVLFLQSLKFFEDW